MREKEGAEDYRFISEPDLPVLKLEKPRIEEIRRVLPETPHEKLRKLIKKHKIEKKHAEILTKKLDIVEFFEKVAEKSKPKSATYWVTIELLRVLNYAKKELEEVDIKPEHFIELLNLVENNTITALKAKELLNQFIPKSFSIKEKLKAGKHAIISSIKEIEDIIKKVIKENQKAVSDFKAGKQESLNFLLGQVMKHSNKRADFAKSREALKKMLKN